MSSGPRPTESDREVRELLRPLPELRLPSPAYRGQCIANIPATLWAASRGSPPPPEWGLLPGLVPSLDPFAGRAAAGPAVVFLVDGLGWYPFEQWARQDGPRRATWGARARPVTTVFPTTTTAALTSISTGVAPGTHGLVGYRQYLPRFGVVADVLRMSPVGVVGSDLLVHPGFRPSFVSGVPSVFRRGLRSVAVSRDRFEHTGFTRVLYDGAEFVPYATAADLAHRLVRVLGRRRPPPVVYTYWDELDTIQHLRGPGTPSLFELELDHVAGLVEYVARHLPGRRAQETTLLVTGDHGQVPSGRGSQVRIDRLPTVTREMAHPLGGDRRAGFFAAKPGRLPALTRALRRALPEGSRLLSTREVVGAGLLGPGPFHPELDSRLGELLVLVPAPWGMRDFLPGAPAPARHLFGAHGGLAPSELLVPLVAGALADFAGAAGRRAHLQQR